MADLLRQAARTIAGARDEQVTRVVALVDAMPVRGPADALIAPLRDRLRRLRPLRPLRFGRVLFSPLDPVIVPAGSWRGGTAAIPRTALTPLEAIVRDHLGVAAAAMEAATSGADPDAAARTEAPLWAAAAAAMRAAAERAPTPAWAAAGLADDAFRPIARAAAAVLATGAEINGWAAAEWDTPVAAEADLARAFAAARPAGAVACAMLGAVLLARLPRASAAILEAMASLAKEDAVLAGTCTDLAVNAICGQMEGAMRAGIDSAPLADAVRDAQRAALLLAGIAKDAGPRRRERLEASRDGLEAVCRRRFAVDLTHALIEPLSGGIAPIAGLEAVARELRSFETAARQLGGAGDYDARLRRAAEQVHGLPESVPVTLADRVRLVEILAGPEDALRLFALG